MSEQSEIKIFKNLDPRPDRAERAKSRQYIFYLKELVYDFEENNSQYVIFYHREDQWWHIGGNSMLFFYYRLRGSLGLKKLTIRHDNDYNHKKWKHGYITVTRIEKLKGAFATIECKMVVENPEIVVFKLPKPVPEDEIEAYKHTEENKIERFNALVVPENKFPKVLSKAAILQREVVNKAVNLSEPRRRYYGDQGVDAISWVALNAIHAANNRISPKEFFIEALQKSDYLNDWLAYVKKFDMFDIDTDISIAQQNIELRDLLKKELRKIEKAEKIKENKNTE